MIARPSAPYSVPLGSLKAPDDGFDEVKVHVPETVGVILNQSRSPTVSIVPVMGTDRFDQVQLDDKDDPQSSARVTPEPVVVPGCETDMVLVMPPPVIVTTPDLDEVAVLVVAESVTVWLPEPDDGEADNQAAFDDTDHDTFAVTKADIDAAAVDGTIHELMSTESDAVVWPCCDPGCETLMIFIIPPPLIVK